MPDALGRLMRRAGRSPDDAIISQGDTALGAAGLVARVTAVAGAMPTGARLGVLAEDGADWFVVALAARAVGATLVPLPLFFSEAQLGHVVQDAAVDVIAVSPSQAARAVGFGRRLLALDGACAAGSHLADRGGRVIAYTSGTTGRPKGAVLDAAAIDIKATVLSAASGARPADVYLSMLPMSLLLEHICAIHGALLSDACVVVVPKAASSWGAQEGQATLAAITGAEPSVTVLVPSLLAAWVGLLEATGRRAPASLRFVAVGGAPVAAGLAARAWEVGLPVHEGYGLTECCSVVALARMGERRPGTVGRPLPGVRIDIDDGEIVVDDPSLMSGYLGGSAAVRPWRTGDVGHIDEAGHLVVLGRRDDVIVTAQGRNVAPGWPESLLLAEPSVAHCIVLPGGAWPTAIVEPSRDDGAALEDAMARAWQDLPDYARPRGVVTVAAGSFAGRGWLRPDGGADRRAVAAAGLHGALHDGACL